MDHRCHADKAPVSRWLTAATRVGENSRMATIVVSGSSSGIGAAVYARLRAAGHSVIGIDIQRADIVADLSLREGRRTAVSVATSTCGGRLDGLVACAGVGPHVRPHGKIVEVNYFGALALFDGLRPALAAAGRSSAVAVSSNSIGFVPGVDGEVMQACLAGEEGRATALAGAEHGPLVYAATKLALARWVRRHAVTPEWAGAGIRLNAVAPGAIDTPLLQDGLEHPELGNAIRSLPIPAGGHGTPDQAAAAIEFLLGDGASFCCGTVLYVDGGSDALLRPNVP